MELDVVDCIVEEVTSEYAIALCLSGGAEVRIETQFEFTEPGHARLVVDPQGIGTDRGLLRALVGRAVEKVSVEVDSGSLVVTFHGGTTLHVRPDADFEAWTATWPDGTTLVSLPGGGLSKWNARE